MSDRPDNGSTRNVPVGSEGKKANQPARAEASVGAFLPAERPQWRQGDARDLSFLPAQSVDLIVTSPPYWQRRDYGHPDQLGREATPAAYVEALIRAMEGWVRLLKPHGSVFLNLGDTYRDGCLVGIPARFELAAREAGWRIPNRISWTKEIGTPEPSPNRLASRHEPVFHLTRAVNASGYFFDLFALARDLGGSANPGDVWRLHPARSRSDHVAPFPPELARRAILLACPERVCARCGTPHSRVLEPTADLDESRPQARRAKELFQDNGLTEAHLAAIRAVGISDAGKGKRLQSGSGKNTTRVMQLADEAKEALGGYFREFTFGPKRQVGWAGCRCHAPATPGTVLDPFMGSGTTLLVAEELGRRAVGVDIVAPLTLKTAH